MADLKDINVAILVDDGFEEVELVEPWEALHRADARIRIVSPKPERGLSCAAGRFASLLERQKLCR